MERGISSHFLKPVQETRIKSIFARNSRILVVTIPLASWSMWNGQAPPVANKMQDYLCGKKSLTKNNKVDLCHINDSDNLNSISMPFLSVSVINSNSRSNTKSPYKVLNPLCKNEEVTRRGKRFNYVCAISLIEFS